MDPVSLATTAITAAASAAASYGVSEALKPSSEGGAPEAKTGLPGEKPKQALPAQQPARRPAQGGGSMYQSFLAGAASAPPPSRGTGKTLLGQ